MIAVHNQNALVHRQGAYILFKQMYESVVNDDGPDLSDDQQLLAVKYMFTLNTATDPSETAEIFRSIQDDEIKNMLSAIADERSSLDSDVFNMVE